MATTYRRSTLDLGPLRSSHAPSEGPPTIVVLLVLVAIPCALAIALVVAAVRSAGIYALAGAIAGIPSALAFWLLIPARRKKRNDVLEVHERGLLQRLSGVETAFEWSAIAGCRTLAVDVRGPAGPISSSEYLTLTLDDGRTITLSDAWQESLVMRRSVRDEVRRARLTRVRQRWAVDEPMTFGDIGMHRTRGLTRDGNTLAWDEISRCDIEQSFITVYARSHEGRERVFTDVPWDELSDADTFLALVAARGDPDIVEARWRASFADRVLAGTRSTPPAT